jgi:site-specific DNA-methyltransferase (adenine-specific)
MSGHRNGRPAVTSAYWSDDLITLYLGDCRKVTEWLAADVLVTDPPYGIAWSGGALPNGGPAHGQIAGDGDLRARDDALTLWGDRIGAVFGDALLPRPEGSKQALIYGKPPNAGFLGARAGFRRDIELIYLLGPWPVQPPARSSIIRTAARSLDPMAKRHGHPHTKPVDVMETLIAACPPGVIADPFAGSGSTLVAARNLGRRAIGVEIDERYAERAAGRLSQGTLELA